MERRPLYLAFGRAFRAIRKAKGLTQEDFEGVSSRTYISTIERGLKIPTVEKIAQLAGFMDYSPLTLYTLMYMEDIERAQEELKIVSAIPSRGASFSKLS
jgi:transcriptional regulator with XRE-family HTH domain